MNSIDPQDHQVSSMQLAPLTQKRPLLWFANAAFHWAWIAAAAAFAGSVQTWWGYAIAVLVVGTRQHGLSLLAHDGVHGHVTRNKTVNDLATGALTLWPFLAKLDSYRDFHFRHHRFLETADDPELKVKAWSAPAWDLPLSPARLSVMVLIDLLGIGVIFHKYKILLHFLKHGNDRHSRAVITDQFLVGKSIDYVYLTQITLFWTLIVVALAMTHQLWLLGLWFGAVFTSFLACFHLRTWMEHVGASETHRLSANFWQRAIFLQHNTWCHYEHHAFPQVPFWNLPALRALDRSATPVISVTQAFRALARAPARLTPQISPE